MITTRTMGRMNKHIIHIITNKCLMPSVYMPVLGGLRTLVLQLLGPCVIRLDDVGDVQFNRVVLAFNGDKVSDWIASNELGCFRDICCHGYCTQPSVKASRTAMKRSPPALPDASRYDSAKPRTMEDIDKDLKEIENPFHNSLTRHVRKPENWEQTLRLLRHLLVEQVLLAPSIDACVAVYNWLTQGWPFEPAYELFKGFVVQIYNAGVVCPNRKEEVRVRMVQFHRIVAQQLKSVPGYVHELFEPRKRKHSDLAVIPEESENMKRSASLDSITPAATM